MDSIIVINHQTDVVSQAFDASLKTYAYRYELGYQDASGVQDVNTEYTYPLIIPIGGDGTLLQAANLALRYPDHVILPINRGHLGFLTNGDTYAGFETLEKALDALVPLDLWDQASEVARRGFKIEERMALQATGVNSFRHAALNEFFIACDHNEMMTYTIFVNDKKIAEQSGSGVLVATSTGSTAQALSAGGSIISPDTNVIQIVPVVSHSLTSRPIIITGRSTVTIEVKSSDRFTKAYLHADGQNLFETKNGFQVYINKHANKVYIARSPTWDFYEVLSEKLGWK